MPIRPDAFLADGWVCMPYTGSDLSRVEISGGSGEWVPAYLDWHNGDRVAKVRPHTLASADLQGAISVSLRVDGVITSTGRVRL
jgi:hypothetical protein